MFTLSQKPRDDKQAVPPANLRQETRNSPRIRWQPMAVPKLGCVARYFLNFHRSGDVRAITLAFSARAATAAIVPPRRRRSFLRLLFSPRWSSGSFSASRVVNHPREAHTFGEITRPALGANRTIKFAALQSAILPDGAAGGRGGRGGRGGVVLFSRRVPMTTILGVPLFFRRLRETSFWGCGSGLCLWSSLQLRKNIWRLKGEGWKVV